MKKRNRRKRFQTVLIVITGFVLLLVVSVAAGLSLVKHVYSDRNEVMKSIVANPQRALIIYQPSVTSAASDVAHAIAKGLNDAGCEVTLNAPCKNLSADISGYSIVVFGSPNYGGSPGHALLDYLNQIEDFSGKRILLFSTSGNPEGRLEFDKMEAALHGSEPYKMFKLAAGEIEKNIAYAYQLGVDAATEG